MLAGMNVERFVMFRLPAGALPAANENPLQRGALEGMIERGAENRRLAQATALMTLPTLSTISPIWSSLMIKGGVSASVSPAMRSIRSLLWKACSMAA